MDQSSEGYAKDLIFRIKENQLVRLLAYPYCVYQRSSRTWNYQHSEHSRRIRVWKDAFRGERCFIIGNGPSLKARDLELIDEKHIATFASNRIYHMYEITDWRPDFYVAFEPEFCRTNADLISQIEVRRARFLNCAAWDARRERGDSFWLNCTTRYSLKKLTTENIEFSEDISVCVNDAYSVTYTIFQLAFYMGFTEIYLLGIDHYDREAGPEEQHFYSRNRAEYQTPTYIEGIESGYRAVREEAERRGIRIYNATRGGKLEVFERVNLEDAVGAVRR